MSYLMGNQTSIPMEEAIGLNFSQLRANISLSDQSYLREIILIYTSYLREYLNKICHREVLAKIK